MLDLPTIDTLTGGRLGVHDLACPECGPERRSPLNRKREVLRIWRVEPGFATYSCARCGIHGHARDGSAATGVDPERVAAIRAEVAERNRAHATERLRIARHLWGRRQPIEGTKAADYLRKARAHKGAIPASLAYLPPSKPEHHPAMIACFAWPIDEPEPGLMVIPDTSVQGVHLTLLRSDGSGKAGTNFDKLMIGQALGTPIPLAPMDDGLGLAIVEGVEDGLAIHRATGLGVWAAGAASRMPALAHTVPGYVDCVTIAADADKAGQDAARKLREALNLRRIYTELRMPGARHD